MGCSKETCDLLRHTVGTFGLSYKKLLRSRSPKIGQIIARVV
jgi:hypothetical protein